MDLAKCTPNRLDNSATVPSSRTAASATFAFNSAVCFFRILAMPHLRPTGRSQAGTFSQLPVQFSGATSAAMPFDGIADPVAAKSLQALDLMEDRLQGGRKWTRHFMFRDGGKMCLLSASYFGDNIGAGRQADRALEYLARAIRPRSRAKDWSDRCWVETTIADFNDNCAGYGEIERVLRAAQELARADITAAQPA